MFHVDHGVGVKIQHSFPQQLQGFVQTKSGLTGREAGHEDVQVGRDRIVFDSVLVMDFHPGVVEHPHVPHVVLVAVHELLKLHGVDEFQDLDLVGALSKLPRHGIQHHLGQGAQPRVVCDLLIPQENPLLLHPVGPTTGFFLDLEPRVYIVLEQPLARFAKVPDLVDVLDLVAHGHSFLEVGCAPYTSQSPLVVRMRTPVGSLQGSFRHFVFHTARAQEKGQFLPLTVWQHRMVQLARWQHFTLDHTKIGRDVCVTRLGDELRMVFWVDGCFVHLRV